MTEQNLQVQESIIGDMKLSVIDANDPPDHNGTAILPHFHSLYEFQYITSGTVVLKTSAGTFHAEAGSYLLVPVKLYHWTEYQSTSFERKVYLFSIERCEGTKRGFSEFACYQGILECMTDICVADNRTVTDLVRQLEELQPDELLWNEHKKKLYFSMLFLKLAEDLRKIFPQKQEEDRKLANDSKAAVNTPVLRTAITDFIAQHYPEDNLLEKLSGQLHMSRRHTTRIISELFGIPLSTLILRQRMNCAYGLIRETGSSLQEISEIIGYSSYSAFYRTFRRYYGCSPEQFRKEQTLPIASTKVSKMAQSAIVE